MLASDLQQRYYKASDAQRLDVAGRYGVDYFVSRKYPKLRLRTALPVAYEIDRFIVHAATAAEPPDAPAP